MNILEAKEQIKRTVLTYMQKDDAGMRIISQAGQRPVFLVGAPGIGKTAIIGQIAQELGVGVVSYSMTHHTRQSALGLPQIVHREYQGREYDASEYTMSEIIGAVYDYMRDTGQESGILFLDEINCVSETLYPSMLQFLQFKTFGRHRVPENWVIVCAGNPPEYNRSVHEFDVVTLDRLREIDVEPDYAAWKRYATGKGVHPAVITFLEAKPDYFYRIETTPGGGKSFVTARGWEDLANAIALYERAGEPCDIQLFGQFLRDEGIAEKFSVYYELFAKYRSDYQVARILDGTAGPEVRSRAKAAPLDERIALLGLILDMLGTACGRAIEHDDVVMQLRDELRAAKPVLLAGAGAEEALSEPLRLREERRARKVAAGTAGASWQRREGLVTAKMQAVVAACGAASAQGGEAFEVASGIYGEAVDDAKRLVEEAGSMMDNAFGFVEECFGDKREMVVFVAELSTREATTQFVSRYGNDRFYAHNSELRVDETRRNLAEQVREVNELEKYRGEAEFGDDNTLDLGSDVGLKKAVAPDAAAATGRAAGK